ncbi:MAG: DUF917 domain-containing protein [Defluviitaleaceae bacterium]|nr:DUF917 domain-containing protein [Defluviitaleaceae bacterium]
MAKTVLRNETDVRDFIRGCTLMGTGGGGLEENGVQSLMSELNAGKEVGWIDVADIADDAVTACPFLMGSIAPHTPELVAEMNSYGMNGETSIYTEKERIARSITELEEYTGKKIEAVVPIELGGAATAGCIAAGLVHGIPTVDGDYTGRAIPEIHQTTPYLHGMKLWPITAVDEFGNVSIIKDAMNHRVSEKLGKKVSEVCYGLTGDTGFLFSGKQTKDTALRGTLTMCLELGRLIREANEQGKDPVAKLAKELGAWSIVQGTLTKKETENKQGYYWGYHTVTGSGEYEGKTAKVWFKNEHHICWLNDAVVATSPDIIVLIDKNTAMPYTNPVLAEGMEIAVLGLKAVDIFRSEKGVSVLGPRYFGFDIDYVPIEERMK